MGTQAIQCPVHGEQPMTFVCSHLAASLETGEEVGFFWHVDPESPRGDAWCQACEDYAAANGGEWTEKTEAFAGVTALCGACYDRLKEANVPE